MPIVGFMGTEEPRAGAGIGIITRMGVMKSVEITALPIVRRGQLGRVALVVS